MKELQKFLTDLPMEALKVYLIGVFFTLGVATTLICIEGLINALI